jgi:uncharacterized protein
MTIYQWTVPQFVKILRQVHRWFDKAEAYAAEKKFDANVLLTSRLAPDQFPFLRQIQGLSDQAKGYASRLAGIEPPKFEDNETTIAELRARIDKTIAYLETLDPKQYEGAADRMISLPFMPGKGLKGDDFVETFALPNFYFHATTAYAILRHNGVDVGKADFIGGLPLRDL